MYKFSDYQKSGWVILSRSDCSWCDKAQDRLSRLGAHYIVRSYEDHPVLRDILMHQEIQTVPQIYHRGKHVGGFEMLEDYLRSLGE